MPLYDYIDGTMDMSTEKLYKNSLKGKEETPNVVHLTHLTTLQSIYHLRIGFCSKTFPVVGVAIELCSIASNLHIWLSLQFGKT